MDRPLRNPELTMKALDFIYKEGRNTLEAFAARMTKADLIRDGWIRDTTEPEKYEK